VSSVLAAYLARLPAAADAAQSEVPAGNREPPGPVSRQLVRVGMPWRCIALATLHALATLSMLASWVFLVSATLVERADPGWLAAWALALASSLAFRVMARRLEGGVAVALGGLLRERLLVGAMALDADPVAALGTGGLLAEVLESDVVDSLGITHALQSALAVPELLIVAAVLGAGAAPALEWGVLFLTAATAAMLMWRNLRLRSAWAEQRLAMTGRAIEDMQAHRTRRAQQPAGEWHLQEDRELAHGFDLARRLDRSTAGLQTIIPRGYLIAAVIALGPAFVSPGASVIELAIALGGAWVAAAAFERLVAGFVRGSAVWIAWRVARKTFEAAGTAVRTDAAGLGTAASGKVLVVRDLCFTHPSRLQPVIDGCSFSVVRGDRILLQGESGSGKSTLAALLAGTRSPASGFILAGGLDRQALGDALWRRRVVHVPQHHQNHIFSATLAFNLLLGRPVPHTPDDLSRAMLLSRELGLGPLIDRMPSGLDQMVGETGWSLSQGECGRIHLARGLLQGGDVLVLDESLAALDPDTLAQCLECVMRRAPTLILIAHP
jgi:ATP-binding cassette subfamily B protein